VTLKLLSLAGTSSGSSYQAPCEAEVEDSEGDEVVDIERIEDKEEDAGEDKDTQVDYISFVNICT
jgi:hypothetical protein